MITSTKRIMHFEGLNARPAALFVQVSSKFKSRIWIQIGNKKVNAKSIMGIISLGVNADEDITIIAEGIDEAKAIRSLEKLIDSNFTCIPEDYN